MDRPILFSGPMVRGLLREAEAPGSGKTQTRRAVTAPGIENVVEFVRVAFDKGTGCPIYEMKDRAGSFVSIPAGKGFVTPHFMPRYVVGDRLWVREAWRTTCNLDGVKPRHMDAGHLPKITYEADPENRNPLWAFGKLRPGMYLPRWASRLTLIVTDVRVERVQGITENDARAEGVKLELYDGPEGWVECPQYLAGPGFRNLWDSLNDKPPKRDFGWDRDPWVVAVTFTVHCANIDAMARAS